MQQKTLIKTVNKIKNLNILDINQIQNEEGSGYYNVWKVVTLDSKYILKQCTENELNNYNNLKSSCIPKFYGYTKYYNKIYILLEYIDGSDFRNGSLDKNIIGLDTIIEVQKAYLNKEIELSDSFEDELNRINKRFDYLLDERLKNKYNEFIEVYKTSIKTVCHNDLLPFNMIISNNKAYLIDLENVGYLPYLTMFSRFIAHYKEETGYLFYLEENIKQELIKYYYDNFVKLLNISYEDFLYDLELFLFFEYTEWIYVYNKYNLKKDERYYYYLSKANELI